MYSVTYNESNNCAPKTISTCADEGPYCFGWNTNICVTKEPMQNAKRLQKSFWDKSNPWGKKRERKMLLIVRGQF